MDDKVEELVRLHARIEELANGERFGANHYDYPPNINLFEILVDQFYDKASNMEWPIAILREILDGQRSLNRQFMHLRNRQCLNKYEAMRNIFSEIDRIVTHIKTK